MATISAWAVGSPELIGWLNPRPTTTPSTTTTAPIGTSSASRAVGNYRLTGATLYVTIEPCLMCVGAFVHARIGTVVYGASEPRTGALESTVRAGDLPGHNHRVSIVGGVCEEECRALMQEFFRARRGRKETAGPIVS